MSSRPTALKYRALKATLLAGTTAALMTVGLAAASAHVDVSPDSTAAGAEALLTFSVPHGCNGSPTTKITINLPRELNDATPTVNPNWTISKTTQHLATPQKLDNGSSVTERTSQIIYTAKTPLDPHQRDALVLAVDLPHTAGKTLDFPTLQTCAKGQTNWAEVAKDGQDPETLNAPMPSVTITAAAAQQGAEPQPAALATPNDDGGSQAPGWIGLAAGLGGLGLGAAALVRTRSRKDQTR